MQVCPVCPVRTPGHIGVFVNRLRTVFTLHTSYDHYHDLSRIFDTRISLVRYLLTIVGKYGDVLGYIFSYYFGGKALQDVALDL